MNFQDDDDDLSEALYANGYWDWDHHRNELKFYSCASESASELYLPPAQISQVLFREDMDTIEQTRFKRRIQRTPNLIKDVVMLQDVKDIALYTAPQKLISPNIINVLHTVTTERFLRALILYFQYYIQIANEMDRRTSELQSKLPTQFSTQIEDLYRDNLNDLRLLTAKEYCMMIKGDNDFRKFHHMGKDKNSPSMSSRELMIYEPFIRICVQIVWIALSRKKYYLIELEVNRLFRSRKFNLVEHKIGFDLDLVMSDKKRQVMWGYCTKNKPIINQHSPLNNEVNCEREMDYRMLSLGVNKYDHLNSRLQYLERYLTISETDFQQHGITLGIIGMVRDKFDIMLRLNISGEGHSRLSTQSSTTKMNVSRRMSRISRLSMASKRSTYQMNAVDIYPRIVIPDKIIEPQPAEFPSKNVLMKLNINKEQYKKWLQRVHKMTAIRMYSLESKKNNKQ